jgi:hypothetical protein
MIDASMADFPILKNWLLTHGMPVRVRDNYPNLKADQKPEI